MNRREKMNCTDIINKLKSCSSQKHKENVVRMGIPEENSIGVSTADIRKLAKEIGRSNGLAYELWKTGYHEPDCWRYSCLIKSRCPATI